MYVALYISMSCSRLFVFILFFHSSTGDLEVAQNDDEEDGTRSSSSAATAAINQKERKERVGEEMVKALSSDAYRIQMGVPRGFEGNEMPTIYDHDYEGGADDAALSDAEGQEDDEDRYRYSGNSAEERWMDCSGVGVDHGVEALWRKVYASVWTSQ